MGLSCGEFWILSTSSRRGYGAARPRDIGRGVASTPEEAGRSLQALEARGDVPALRDQKGAMKPAGARHGSGLELEMARSSLGHVPPAQFEGQRAARKEETGLRACAARRLLTATRRFFSRTPERRSSGAAGFLRSQLLSARRRRRGRRGPAPGPPDDCRRSARVPRRNLLRE